MINNYLACPSRVNLQSLRCPGGTDSSTKCLSDVELGVMNAIHTPYTFSFPLANSLTSYPQWLFGHEDALDGPTAQSLVRWVTGTAAPAVPPNASTNATQ